MKTWMLIYVIRDGVRRQYRNHIHNYVRKYVSITGVECIEFSDDHREYIIGRHSGFGVSTLNCSAFATDTTNNTNVNAR